MRANSVLVTFVLSISLIIFTELSIVIKEGNCDSKLSIYQDRKLGREVRTKTEQKLEEQIYWQQQQQKHLKRGEYFDNSFENSIYNPSSNKLI